MANGNWHFDPAKCLRVQSSEGEFEAYVARPPDPPAAAIVVLHEVFGVNADMRATCDELADEGFVTICPELFWRQSPHVDLSVTSQKDWEQGLALYVAFDLNAGVRDIEATVHAGRALAGPGQRAGVIGFCLGGLLTFLAAARTRVDAAVAFHGARTEEFLAETADIDAPLQMHLADEDEFMPRDAQARIAGALAQNARFEVFNYAGCRHAFSRHGGAHFDADASILSRARTVDFLRRHLG
jgi:carboxymethylenebutenolidase